MTDPTNNNPSTGTIVSMSSNFLSGQGAFVTYYNSENTVEANDAALLEQITNVQAQDTTNSENAWNAPDIKGDTDQDNYIYQLEHDNPSDPSSITSEYTDANQQLSSRNTTRTSQTQMYQQIIGQFPSNQQLLWQTLSSGRGIVDTLSSLISSWVKG
jgi:hypothetical protein